MINRDINLLAPIVQEKLAKALAECHAVGIPAAMFEGFRTPERQENLYWSKPPITKARAWQSYHQYGLAIDMAFQAPDWTWKGDWNGLTDIMKDYGFETVSWERPHFQITHGVTWQECLHITKTQGLQKLWELIAAKS